MFYCLKTYLKYSVLFKANLSAWTERTIGDCNYNTCLGSLLCSRFFGWRKQEGERCVTSKKTAAKETNVWVVVVEKNEHFTQLDVLLIFWWKWENIVGSWKKNKDSVFTILRFIFSFVYFRTDVTHFNVRMSLVTVALRRHIHSKCKVNRNQLLQLFTSRRKENCQHTFCCVKSLVPVRVSLQRHCDENVKMER